MTRDGVLKENNKKGKVGTGVVVI